LKVLTVNAAIIVATDAPIKPSHVFFGDNLIRGVFPKKKPKKYAATSFIAIRDAGKRNLQNYFNMLRKYEEYNEVISNRIN
jgi:hypothetical protein